MVFSGKCDGLDIETSQDFVGYPKIREIKARFSTASTMASPTR